MATNTPMVTTSTISYDETLSTAIPSSVNETGQPTDIGSDLTSYLLIIFPLYVFAIFWNVLTIYTILIVKIYRQYLSNVLLAVICIGALVNIHGQIFLILMRWTRSSLSGQLCASSIYLRDNGSILMHTHILLLAFERILANLKKNPSNSTNKFIQKAHFFLITMSFVFIILSLTIPIFALKHRSVSSGEGLCLPLDSQHYTIYNKWVCYGFGHSFVWLSVVLLTVFLCRKTVVSYSTLIPMNRMILIISLISSVNLLIGTLFDDMIGIGAKLSSNDQGRISTGKFHLMNIRDLISIIEKVVIGFLFFLLRPEIRSWLYESMKKFQSFNAKETTIPQMLDIRNDLDDNYHELDDGNLHFRADM